MMKKIILFILIVWVGQITAQQSTIVYGKVVDKSGLPIAYTNIVFRNSSIGVASNLDGDFRISIDEKHLKDTIIFSAIGYIEKTLPINFFLKNQNNRIVLDQNTIDLKELIVQPKSGIEIVEQALANINKNYNTGRYYLSAFYRESMLEDSVYTQLSEVACQFHLDSLKNFDLELGIDKYANNFWWGFANDKGFNVETWGDNSYALGELDQLKITNARKTQIHSKSLVKFIINSNPMSCMGIDKIRYPLFFLDKRNLKKYHFILEDIIQNGNNRIYKVSFYPKRKEFYEGLIYIDKTSFAIIELDYKITEHQVNENYKKKYPTIRGGVSINQRKPIKDNFTTGPYSAKVKYQQKDGLWYLKSVHQESEANYYFSKEGKKTNILTVFDMVVNDIITENVKPFDEDSIYKHICYTSIQDQPFSYNKDFWDKNNMLLPTKLEQKAIEELEKNESLQDQFETQDTYDPFLRPPVARIEPSFKTIHDDKLIDNYAWLKNRNNPDVQKYLEQENDYLNNYMIPLNDSERSLFYEMINRDRETLNVSDKNKVGSYLYYSVEDENTNFPRLYRIKDENGAQEELLLDIPSIALSSGYFSIGAAEISPDENIFAYSEDKSGDGNYYYIFKDLVTNTYLSDTLYNLSQLIWLKDSKAIYYLQKDSLNRSSKLKYHILNTNTQNDEIVLSESDLNRSLSLNLSNSNEYAFVISKNENEEKIFILDLNSNTDSIRIFSKNTTDYKVYPEHFSNDSVFYVLTNKNAPKWKLCTSSINETLNFDNVIANSKQNVVLKDYLPIGNYLVLVEQAGLSQRIKIKDLHKNSFFILKNKEDLSTIKLKKDSKESKKLFYTISSWGKLQKSYSFNFNTNKNQLVYEMSIKGFNDKNYKSEIVWAQSTNNTRIPILLLYSSKQAGKKPNYLLLDAYSTYDSELDYSFPETYLSIIDKGFVYAKALINHTDNFTDMPNLQDNPSINSNRLMAFTTCSQYLVNKAYTIPEKFVIEGGAKSGTVIGNAINKYPELYGAAILSSPCVDILNTLLDATSTDITESIREWGDPKIERYYQQIKSYSPYENIKVQNYPNLLFIARAKDQEFNYWEPAKMVAKLRQYKTNDNILLLKTYMNSENRGVGEKFGWYKEQAMKFAFILNSVSFYSFQ
jgi:oligopeptidase B